MQRTCDLHRPVSIMIVLLLFQVWAWSPAWGADDSVAQISRISGTASISRGSRTLAAAQGVRLKNGDVVTTGPEGSVGILFDDETALSLGPDSQLSIQEYAFDTERSVFSFVVRIFRGTASYVSGLIAKLSPESARIITPSASIGVRGTKFAVQVDPS